MSRGGGHSACNGLMFVKTTDRRHHNSLLPPAGVAASVESLQAKHVRPLWPALFRISIYLAALAGPLIVILLQESAERHSFLEHLADNFGLLGFTILALQFPIAARVKWIEWPFGLDRIFRFHRALGIFAAVLLLCHPVLMALGGETEILTDLRVKWPVQVGRVALLVLLATIGISLSWQKLSSDFEQWRRSHNLLAIPLLLLAFVHSSFVGEDLGSLSMRLIWVALLIAAAAAYIHHRLIWPRYTRAWYAVSDVKQETHNVWTLIFKPVHAELAPAYLPGQFHFITLYREGMPVEEHPFSVSSSPADCTSIASTIKESGDFTSTIKHTKAGDRALIRGPYGRFCHLLNTQAEEFVFVAGGVGITPLMSMLRYTRDSGQWRRPTLLLYANRTERDILFRSELDAMADQSELRFRVVYLLSQPEPSWPGERGHLTLELLGRFGDQLKNKHYYICGPSSMTRQAIKLLTESGVDPRQIRTEMFALSSAPGGINSDRVNWVVAVVIAFALSLALLFAWMKESTDQTDNARRSSVSSGIASAIRAKKPRLDFGQFFTRKQKLKEPRMPCVPSVFERLTLLTFNQGPGGMLDLLGAQAFRAVCVAVKLDVFEALKSGPSSASETARKISADEQGTTLLLGALDALGYVRETDKGFVNTPMTAKWLLRDSPTSLVHGLRFFENTVFERWGYLEESIRRGKPKLYLHSWLDQQPDHWRAYQDGMMAVARVIADEVVARVRLPPNACRLLDVGGGHGLYSTKFCRRYPHLSSTIFDLPQALAASRATGTMGAADDRVRQQPGDFWREDLGASYDVALLFNIVHASLPEKNLELLTKVARALNRGGLIVVMDQMAGNGSGPAGRVLVRLQGLNFFNDGGGRTYEYREIVQWVTTAGFTNPRRIKLRRLTGFSLVLGTKVG